MTTQDDDYIDQACPICGYPLEWQECWQCFGAGGFHDCGEDCCPCLEPELDLNETCGECLGHGGYLQCTGLPHTPEDMARARKEDNGTL